MIRLTRHKMVLALALAGTITACASSPGSRYPASLHAAEAIAPGADRFGEYLPLIRGKRLGLVCNQSSLSRRGHLLDVLHEEGFAIKKIFALEHGLRGDRSDGEAIENGVDPKTGAKIVSLYGAKKEPSTEDLADVDVILYDVQDVGVRTYTFISSLHYVLLAAAKTGKQMLVLDRPNPNGDYVAGPVLDPVNRSFVGMHPIPLVYALTPGELARMILGEGWLDLPNSSRHPDFRLTVVPVDNYGHAERYFPPVPPSPNLPNPLSVRLYPSLVLFEATGMSVGRGTDFPFQAFGYPDPSFGSFTFTPRSRAGASENPPHKDQACYGVDLRAESLEHRFSLSYLQHFFSRIAGTVNSGFFKKLSGDSNLEAKLRSANDVGEIEAGWEPALANYRRTRSHYLIYPDTETPEERALALFTEARATKLTPGGVLYWSHGGSQTGSRAYGCPDYSCREKVTKNQVYDVASLTKLFTATAVLVLAQDGKLRLDDPVRNYISEFSAGAKHGATIRHLLTHTAGLKASVAITENDPRLIWKKILTTPNAEKNGRELRPGERFIYSDLGFLVLGRLVEIVSKQSLQSFFDDRIFGPLGMADTGFLPGRPASYLARIAPTGAGATREVHDEKARALGGVAGHAGVFSTASDLARFAREFLAPGQGKVLTAQHIALMTTADKLARRGLGWDVFSAYSLPLRGSFFLGTNTVNHTGFTGTSLLIDRDRNFFWILLTNRVLPGGESGNFSINQFREAISNALGHGL